jgi:hypothetical protein
MYQSDTGGFYFIMINTDACTKTWLVPGRNTPSTHLTTDILKLSKSDTRNVTGLLTGHWYFHTGDTLCRLCGEVIGFRLHTPSRKKNYDKFG